MSSLSSRFLNRDKLLIFYLRIFFWWRRNFWTAYWNWITNCNMLEIMWLFYDSKWYTIGINIHIILTYFMESIIQYMCKRKIILMRFLFTPLKWICCSFTKRRSFWSHKQPFNNLTCSFIIICSHPPWKIDVTVYILSYIYVYLFFMQV